MEQEKSFKGIPDDITVLKAIQKAAATHKGKGAADGTHYHERDLVHGLYVRYSGEW